MDFNTHKKYAKIDDGVNDSQNMGVLISNPDPDIVKQEKEMDEADKLAKIISDALLNKYQSTLRVNIRDESTASETPDEMKERVLLVSLALPLSPVSS